ncbi:MAG: hypothetical protein DRJ03_28030 [Chloroflexi bacterium]|nr:MAG: hypothetical protein DRJ03_28030 [Chloroflexota bacterium]
MILEYCNMRMREIVRARVAGNSIVITIPRSIVERLNVRNGDFFEIGVEGRGEIRLRRLRLITDTVEEG